MGCGEISDTTFFPVLNSQFIVGPNPANQFINIFFGGDTLNIESLNFVLSDIEGRLVYSFKPTSTETTYMLNAEQFARGLYVLSLNDGKRILQQEKIVLER